MIPFPVNELERSAIDEGRALPLDFGMLAHEKMDRDPTRYMISKDLSRIRIPTCPILALPFKDFPREKVVFVSMLRREIRLLQRDEEEELVASPNYPLSPVS